MLGMDELLAVWVSGRPRTKGSLKGARTGAGALRMSDSPQSKLWRKEIKDAVVPLIADPVVVGVGTRQEQTRWKLRAGWPFRGPVVVGARFYFARGGSEDDWPIGHQFGDLDKLMRNVLDALQDARVYLEDCQVRKFGEVGKYFCDVEGRGEGAMIVVRG